MNWKVNQHCSHNERVLPVCVSLLNSLMEPNQHHVHCTGVMVYLQNITYIT